MLGRLLALVAALGAAVAAAAETPELVLNNANDAPFTTPVVALTLSLAAKY